MMEETSVGEYPQINSDFSCLKGDGHCRYMEEHPWNIKPKHCGFLEEWLKGEAICPFLVKKGGPSLS